MFNIRDVIRKHNATFYDYNTGARQSQSFRLCVTGFIALFATLLFADLTDNLLTGFLAVQAILLGFTVNTMFYLLNNRELPISNHSSLEAQLRSEKSTLIYRELFYNVCYFNLLSVLSIVVVAGLLLPKPALPDFITNASILETIVNAVKKYKNYTSEVINAVKNIGVFTFYFLALEVLWSILRIIDRTAFYFGRKMLSDVNVV